MSYKSRIVYVTFIDFLTWSKFDTNVLMWPDYLICKLDVILKEIVTLEENHIFVTVSSFYRRPKGVTNIGYSHCFFESECLWKDIIKKGVGINYLGTWCELRRIFFDYADQIENNISGEYFDRFNIRPSYVEGYKIYILDIFRTFNAV